MNKLPAKAELTFELTCLPTESFQKWSTKIARPTKKFAAVSVEKVLLTDQSARSVSRKRSMSISDYESRVTKEMYVNN